MFDGDLSCARQFRVGPRRCLPLAGFRPRHGLQPSTRSHPHHLGHWARSSVVAPQLQCAKLPRATLKKRFIGTNSETSIPLFDLVRGTGRYRHGSSVCAARRRRAVTGCSLSHSFRAVFIRVCQPGPLDRNAARTSGSKRMATCSLVGFLFFPRVLRSVLRVAATPPPGVTTAFPQSIPLGDTDVAAAACAAAICSALKIFKVILDFRAVGIAARD